MAKGKSKGTNPIHELRDQELEIRGKGGRAARDVAALLAPPRNDDEELKDWFNQISWRLALRLGYADHIELVRSTMMRFMETHILNHLLDLNEDPMGGDSNGSVRGLHSRNVYQAQGVNVKHIASGSFFGACFLAVEVLNSPLPNGRSASTYWGLSKDLYMQPVHERILRLHGVASVLRHNLKVIEQLLKDTVGQTKRKKLSAEETLHLVEQRKETIRALTDKSSLLSGRGLIRKHVLGEGLSRTAFCGRGVICGGSGT